MKNQSSPNPCSVNCRARLARANFVLRLLVASVCLAGATRPARAQEPKLEVDVRAKVIDGWLHPDEKHSAEGNHSKLYGVLSLAPIPGEYKLVKPVDANAMLEILHHELAANGFKKVPKGQKPDILLTVSYGRGYLGNPFIKGTGQIQTGVDQVNTLSINGAFPLELYEAKELGHEAKLQAAQYEKLYIRVTAFEFPKDPKAKAKMLWKTIMVVDDPDHRDMNVVMGKMFEAGVPYFDREPKQGQVEVFKPIPDGRVNVGTPEVVEPAPTTTK